MRCLWLLVIYSVCLKISVNAELSLNSCSFLRSLTSIVTIVPELAQMSMRHYGSSLEKGKNERSTRRKRFLADGNTGRDTNIKTTFIDQMVANAFKDVNFTRVGMIMLQNNDTMNKLKQNIDTEVIIRAAMKNLDYDQLGDTIWSALENEFDLEHFLGTIINITHFDIIHHEFVTNGTLPAWLITSFHPEMNVERVNKWFFKLKTEVLNWVYLLTSSQRLDDHLYQLFQTKLITPLEIILKRIQDEKPTTLDQLVNLILNNINKYILTQKQAVIDLKSSTATPTTKTARTTTTTMSKKSVIKKPVANPSSPTIESTATTTTTTTEEEEEAVISDDIQLFFYQCSVVLDSFGQTTRNFLKAIERLYCTSVWE